MNTFRASGHDWKSKMDAMSAATPLWLVMAGILAVAMGVCPPHLYL